MIRLKVSAEWSTPEGKKLILDDRLLSILKAVNQKGSLSLACKDLDISYRTLWSQIQQWNQNLGKDIIQTQGRAGATLTRFGHKLMWMCEQGSVRVLNEISAAAEHLNAEWSEEQFNRPWVSMALSDDPLLQDLIQNTTLYRELDISLRWSGGISALSSLHRGEVKLAGCHLPVNNAPDNEAFQIMRKWLRGENLAVIKAFTRELGWMHRKSVHPPTLRDVAMRRALLVNRTAASTTHHQLRSLVISMGLVPEELPGFFHEETSHLAVACSIAAGHGDLGLGVREAARRYNLTFQPICEENYFFVFNQADQDFPAISALRHWLNTEEVRCLIERQSGYHSQESGLVMSLEGFLAQICDTSPPKKASIDQSNCCIATEFGNKLPN